MTTPEPPSGLDPVRAGAQHVELPLDPDLPREPVDRARPPRPLHLSPRALGVVAAGGVVGTAARYRLSLLIQPWRSWPLATFVINVAGAFVLGLLLEGLARRGPDHGALRRLRLLVGTGFCGAFTTYSALAVDADLLVRSRHPGLAVSYALGTVVVGFLASALGIWAATRHVRRTGGTR